MDIMAEMANYEMEITTIVKLLLASLFGGLIGLEREMKGRPAGLKTFSLVCIGAALIMITNDYISNYLGYGGDSARMAAQIISGIGFLGAGTIMVTGQSQVKGLTTAAALWVTAALGIVIGAGYYFGGILAVCVIYGTSFIYRYIDRRIMERSRIMRIYVEGKDEEFLLRLLDYFNRQNMKVTSLVRKPENMWYKDDTCAMIEVDIMKRREHASIMAEIHEIGGLVYIEEI